jgi:hypothetical protein
VTGSSNHFWDATNNRLGIGLTNPQRSLEIYSATADSHLRLSGSAPSVSMGEAVTGSVYQAKFGLATAAGQYVSGAVAGDFVMLSQTGATIFATSATEKARLTSAGLLGIGTTSPSAALHISGSTYASSRIYLQRTSGAVGTYSMGVQNENNAFGITDEGQGNLTRFYINGSGNVGIGTSSPSGAAGLALVLNSGANQGRICIKTSATGDGSGAGLQIGMSGADAFIEQRENAALSFATNASERMRITSSGHVLIGQTTASGNTNGMFFRPGIQSGITSTNTTTLELQRLGSTGNVVEFYNQTVGPVGSISVTTTLTSYNITSDYRLKQDFKDYNGLDLISKIKTYDYEWKADNSRMFGVVAHELQEVIPYAVTGEKDAEEMQQVDYSKLTPINTKAIQELYKLALEQQAQIELLSNKIVALESK